MDTPNPSADEGGGGAGAARPENSTGSGGFGPAARREARTGSSMGPVEFRLLEAAPGRLDLAGPSDSLEEWEEDEEPLLVTGTDGLRAPPSSDTTATPTALEEPALRLASGLESMNLTGGEPPAVVGPSTSGATTAPRKRTPGKWRRIPHLLWSPPDHTPDVKAEMEKSDLVTLKNLDFIKNMRKEDCDLHTEQDHRDFHAFKENMTRALTSLVYSKPENIFFTSIKYTDTKEEQLTAEGMEAYMLAQFPDRKPCQQAIDFAELSLAHYNKKKTVDVIRYLERLNIR